MDWIIKGLMITGDCCPSKRWATLAKLKFLDICRSSILGSLIIEVVKFEDRYEHGQRYPGKLDVVYVQPEKANCGDQRHATDLPVK